MYEEERTLFCQKCGKEIHDEDQFCQYCGSSVEDTDGFHEPLKRTKKGWILGGVIAGIVTLGVLGAVAVGLPKNEEKSATKVKQASEIKEKKVKKEEPFQKKAFQPDAATEAGLNQFVTALAWADFFGVDLIKAYDDATFCSGFLYWAVRMDFGIGRVLTKYDLDPNYGIYMTEEQVREFLINSIGKADLSEMRYENGMIRTAEGDPGTRSVERVVFDQMMQISETDIQISGVAYYRSEGEDAGRGTFTITMTKNPDSVWGGYTLKAIDSWERKLLGYEESTYVLWNSDSSYYTKERLESMNPHDLSLARNEIYARHGYIFKNPELQEFFESKSWYVPISKNVSDKELNDYERANVKLILSLEKK